MADFNEDFFFDPGITIKQEPITVEPTINISASVPIPTRRVNDMSGYRDFQFGFDVTQSPTTVHDTVYFNHQQIQIDNNLKNNAMWGSRDVDDGAFPKQESMNMEDDDIFKVDKADLIQGPTLAELNANDDTLLGDLNFDDLLLPEEGNYISSLTLTQALTNKLNMPYFQLNNNNNVIGGNVGFLATSCPSNTMGYYRDSPEVFPTHTSNYIKNISLDNFSPPSQNGSHSSLLNNTPPPVQSVTKPKHSTLHELLLKQDKFTGVGDQRTQSKSVSSPKSPTVSSNMPRSQQRSVNSRLSSSAPTHLGLEQIWQRREPRKHLLSTGSLVEAESTSSISTGGVLSPDAHDLSQDEQDYDEDSEHYEDFSSDDGDSEDEDDQSIKGNNSSKKERFFWQYNVQAKGPKGQRLVMKTKMENPHVLNEITDPVFSSDCAVRGIKHSGKARKGDGNDLTPNPRKLYNIGKELDKLGRIINDMTPVSELPFNIRPKSRKEKNKLASRACRLKKKAQHEANKIKLHGLEIEHRRLMNALAQIRQLLGSKLKENNPDSQQQLSKGIEKITKNCSRTKIAGQSTEYVNRVLDKVKGGVSVGALDDL